MKNVISWLKDRIGAPYGPVPRGTRNVMPVPPEPPSDSEPMANPDASPTAPATLQPGQAKVLVDLTIRMIEDAAGQRAVQLSGSGSDRALVAEALQRVRDGVVVEMATKTEAPRIHRPMFVPPNGNRMRHR